MRDVARIPNPESRELKKRHDECEPSLKVPIPSIISCLPYYQMNPKTTNIRSPISSFAFTEMLSKNEASNAFEDVLPHEEGIERAVEG